MIFVYILKFKPPPEKFPLLDWISNKNEDMYALLVVYLPLGPQKKLATEIISAQLKENYVDKMLRMQRYADESYTMDDVLHKKNPKTLLFSICDETSGLRLEDHVFFLLTMQL